MPGPNQPEKIILYRCFLSFALKRKFGRFPIGKSQASLPTLKVLGDGFKKLEVTYYFGSEQQRCSQNMREPICAFVVCIRLLHNDFSRHALQLKLGVVYERQRKGYILPPFSSFFSIPFLFPFSPF